MGPAEREKKKAPKEEEVPIPEIGLKVFLTKVTELGKVCLKEIFCMKVPPQIPFLLCKCSFLSPAVCLSSCGPLLARICILRAAIDRGSGKENHLSPADGLRIGETFVPNKHNICN